MAKSTNNRGVNMYCTFIEIAQIDYYHLNSLAFYHILIQKQMIGFISYSYKCCMYCQYLIARCKNAEGPMIR